MGTRKSFLKLKSATKATAPRSNQTRRLSVENLEDRLLLYALSGSQWTDTNVSFSYVPDGTDANSFATDLFAELNSIAPTEAWQREFARALQTWAEVADLNFHCVADDGSSIPNIGQTQGDSRYGDIRLLARSAGGLASASSPPTQTFGFTGAGDILLNSDESFSIGSYPDLFSVLLHESGHSLGLRHSTSGTVMYGALTGTYSGLTADDIGGIRAIYGPREPDAYDAAASNNSISSATSVTLDNSGQASLGADLTSRADVDYFELTAPDAFDGTFSVSVDARGLSLLAPMVSVYDGQGNLLATASSGTAYGDVATVSLAGLVAGQTYVIMADGATDDVFGIGAYQLDVQFGGTIPPPPGISVSPTSNLVTSESGDTADFQIVLRSQPTDDVRIAISSNNTSEGEVSATSLTFTSSNWNAPQTVTITGADDTAQDGDIRYTIVTGAAVSGDALYDGLNPDDVSVTNLDDDSPPPEPGLQPDRFETNDSLATATDFGVINGKSEMGLTIHSSSDHDFFSFVARKRGTFQIATQFAHADGDLDLTVYDASGNVLASSTTSNDDESVSLSLSGRQRYYVEVHSPAGDTNSYDFSITKGGGGGGGGGNGNGNGKGNGKPGGKGAALYLVRDGENLLGDQHGSAIVQFTPDIASATGHSPVRTEEAPETTVLALARFAEQFSVLDEDELPPSRYGAKEDVPTEFVRDILLAGQKENGSAEDQSVMALDAVLADLGWVP